MGRRPIIDEQTIWLRVDKQSTPPCWMWTGRASTPGYGQVTVRMRGERQAHRVIYTLLRGPIPDGLTLDHLCRNRRCVNPDHLEPVTARENILRGIGPAAIHARATHCAKGHPYDEANTYRWTSRLGTARCCRACNREAARRYKARTRPVAFG